MAASLTLDNPVFANFAFYATVVILKMMLMSSWTSMHRISKGVFSNVEDVKFSVDRAGAKPIMNDPDVERVRRGHLNDMENIPPFLVIGLLYVLTGPSPFTALLHFRVFAASRLLHTFFYQFAIPQPTRGLAFFVGFLATISMGIQVLMAAQF